MFANISFLLLIAAACASPSNLNTLEQTDGLCRKTLNSATCDRLMDQMRSESSDMEEFVKEIMGSKQDALQLVADALNEAQSESHPTGGKNGKCSVDVLDKTTGAGLPLFATAKDGSVVVGKDSHGNVLTEGAIPMSEMVSPKEKLVDLFSQMCQEQPATCKKNNGLSKRADETPSQVAFHGFWNFGLLATLFTLLWKYLPNYSNRQAFLITFIVFWSVSGFFLISGCILGSFGGHAIDAPSNVETVVAAQEDSAV